MLKRVFVFLVAGCFGLVMVSAQQLPFQKTSEDEYVFKEKTFTEVWSAVVKSLMQLKYGITSSDKEGGLISALKKKGLLDGDYKKDEMPTLQIFVEEIEEGEGIKVNCQATNYSGQLFGGFKPAKLLKRLLKISTEKRRRNKAARKRLAGLKEQQAPRVFY